MTDQSSANPREISLSSIFGWLKAHPWAWVLAPLILLAGVAVVLVLSLGGMAGQASRDQQAAAALKQEAKDARAEHGRETSEAQAEIAAGKAGITLPGGAPKPPPAADSGRSAQDVASGFNDLGKG